MYTSKELREAQKLADAPIITAIFTYLSYTMLYLVGHFRDFLVKLKILKEPLLIDERTKSFVPLLSDFESFFKRNLYQRIVECWNMPINGCAGARIDVLERKKDSKLGECKLTGNTLKAINVGSYNYLGFGDPCEEYQSYLTEILYKYGISTCSKYCEYGRTKIHKELDKIVAKFVRKEAAICFPIGFATNSGNIQALLDEKCCIISDELNHASLVLGARLSGCKVFVYKHNDMQHLETILREIIVQGRQRNHRDWSKIILLIEGIYSMEGTFIDLPAIVALKKKYKFYIYLDEAHSIGCTGETGRGVTEFFGIDTREIDIMMGTFTKSFGSCGGYIAADRDIIELIRDKSYCTYYGITMAPLVCAQVIVAIKVLTGQICGDLGQKKLSKIKENIKYFRTKIQELGYIIYGHDSSPVVPILIYVPGKLELFSRMMLERNVAVVVVGFPATSILCSRARFCISSSHTKEMLDEVLSSLDEVGTKIVLKYKKNYIRIFS